MQSYPPNGTGFEASRTSLGSDEESNKKGGATVVDMRDITRTPSPTPSESEELKKTNLIDWKAMGRWKFWIRREWLCACRFSFLRLVMLTRCCRSRVLRNLHIRSRPGDSIHSISR